MKDNSEQDSSWQTMGEQWRARTPFPAGSSSDVLVGVRKAERQLLWLAGGSVCLAISAMAVLTALAILHPGILSWTFAVIGWSLFLPLGSYLWAYRGDLVPDTRDTSSMLEGLLRKQVRKQHLLEFLGTLAGVETIIATAFWLVANWEAPTHAGMWTGLVAILFTGIASAALLRWQKSSTEARLRVISDVNQDFRTEG